MRTTQDDVKVIVGLASELPVAAGLTSGCMFFATDTQSLYVLSINAVTHVASWNLIVASGATGTNHLVDLVATSNISPLSGLTALIDGFTANTDGMRVLLAKQSNNAENGIWVVHSGAWTRPADWASGSTVPVGTTVSVSSGSNWRLSTWKVTTSAGVVDDPLGTMVLFPQFSKGTANLNGGGSAVANNQWVISSSQPVIITNTTSAHDVAILLTQGPGTGSVQFAGTAGDVLNFAVVNW